MNAIGSIVHNAAVTFLIASFGFMVSAVVASNTPGFEPWRDGLGTTALWNSALAVMLYAFQVVLHVGEGFVRLIASRRRAQP